MPILLALFFISLATLAIVHIVSLEFYLYWKYLWLDIPIHFLGGISVALGFSILPFFRITVPAWFTTAAAYVLAVLFVGIAWEVFEALTGLSLGQPDFVEDTAIDLVMDALGALTGYALMRSVKKLDSWRL